MGEEQEKVGPASNPSSWLSSSSIVRCTSESPPPDPRALPIESTSQEGHCEQSLNNHCTDVIRCTKTKKRQIEIIWTVPTLRFRGRSAITNEVRAHTPRVRLSLDLPFECLLKKSSPASSMKRMDGACSRAITNSSRTIFAPSPMYFCTSSEP